MVDDTLQLYFYTIISNKIYMHSIIFEIFFMTIRYNCIQKKLFDYQRHKKKIVFEIVWKTIFLCT